MDKDKKIIIYALIALSLFGSAQYFYSPIAPQWETVSRINSVVINGTTYDQNNIPQDTDIWGESHIRLDPDENVEGVADIDISITNPAHVIRDDTGEYVKADDAVPQQTYSKIYGDTQYFYDLHLYSYWVTVIADGETEGLICEGKNGGGSLASINLYSHFILDPWEIGPATFTEGTDTYQKTEAWYGVMSASVIDTYAGLVRTAEIEKTGIEEDDIGFVDAATPASGYDASTTETGALNMYSVDTGTQTEDYSAEIEAEQFDAIQGPQSEVFISTFGQLQAGYTWPPLGSISMSAVMFQIQICVWVLVSAGYVLTTGDQPIDPIDPIIIKTGGDPIGDFFNDLLGGADIFAQILALIVMVLFFYVLIRFLPIIKAMVERFKKRGN